MSRLKELRAYVENEINQLEDEESGYVCTNPDSDNRADWTEYEDSCEEWEEKE